MRRSHVLFCLLCLGALVLLVATAIPAPFTVDDCNYLSSVAALRRGSLYLPGTAGLPPSRMLYAFEPTAATLQSPSTPVPILVPPMYAVIALPFSYLGWHGLVLLNSLATIATACLVFVASRRLAGRELAGWSAAAIWLFGASTIEYAQGVWPHMLAVSLTTAGMILTAIAILGPRLRHAAVAGLLLSLAAGVRYQNVILLLSSLGVLAIWGHPRAKRCAAFVLGALPPLLACSLINHARIHSWNPVSKGVRYLNIGAAQSSSPSKDFLLTLWTRVVDYSAQPPFRGSAAEYLHKISSGEIITCNVLKKSWLQSSPWVLVGIAAILLAWSRRQSFESFARAHLRMLAFPILSVLVVLGLAGMNRHDGLSFNQRYLLELGPVVAIAVGVALARLGVGWRWLVSGAVLGGLLGALVLLAFQRRTGYHLQSQVPLLLACTAALAWLGALSRERWGRAAGLLLSVCLGWSMIIHLATDLQASRLAKQWNARRVHRVEEALPTSSPTAILAALGPHDALGPLLLSHDLVVVVKNNAVLEDPSPVLDALLAQRRVFVWLEGLPQALISQLQSRYRLTLVRVPWLAELSK